MRHTVKAGLVVWLNNIFLEDAPTAHKKLTKLKFTYYTFALKVIKQWIRTEQIKRNLPIRVVQVLGQCRLGTASIQIKNRGDGPPSLIHWFLSTLSSENFQLLLFLLLVLLKSVRTVSIVVHNVYISSKCCLVSILCWNFKEHSNWVIWNHRHLLKVSHRRDWQVANLGFHISNLWNLCYENVWKPEAGFRFWRRHNLKCLRYQFFL